MEYCIYCGTETALHIKDVATCVQCADLSPENLAVRARLFRALRQPSKHSRMQLFRAADR